MATISHKQIVEVKSMPPTKGLTFADSPSLLFPRHIMHRGTCYRATFNAPFYGFVVSFAGGNGDGRWASPMFSHGAFRPNGSETAKASVPEEEKSTQAKGRSQKSGRT